MRINKSAKKMKVMLFALLVWTCFIGDVSAQIIDDIILNKAADGKVVAIIKLSGPVQYLRHFPDKEGQHLEIFFNILADSASSNEPWQGYEARTSPSSDLIPSFMVSVRDLNIQPRLIVEFSRPAKYSVSISRNRRSFIIHIQPDKTQPSNGKAKPVKERQDTKNEAPAPQPEIKAVAKAGVPGLPGVVKIAPKNVPPAIAAASVAASVPATVSAPAPVAAPATATVSVPAATSVAAAASVPEATSAPATASVPATDLAPVATEASPADQLKEADSQAEAWMVKGRDALKINEYGLAIEAFNKVLLLPPNKYSQDAQEWVGVAREDAGQKFKAKLEYESYLKMYTSGAGVDRVKERLAKLSAAQPVNLATEKTGLPKEKKNFETVSNGGLAMYYFHGSNLTTVAGVANTTGPVTDQSMLITNVNASLRSRNDQYDNRLVFQDTYNKNYLTTTSQTNPNRVSAAYYDFKNRTADFSSRIGRQSSSGGGIMGRFDGISASYGFTPNLHTTASTGSLSEFTTGSKPVFYGFGLGIGGIGNNQQWNSSVYYVNQKTDGITDRSAVGVEERYFDTNKNAYAILDYDTSFKVINIALLQGTITDRSGTSYNFLVDHRKTPSISIRNALIGSPSTMATLLQNGFTQDDLKALAILRTGFSNSFQAGVTRQIKEKWQAGADIRVSNTSALPESGTPFGLEGFVAATPVTGNNWGITGRLIGNSVFSTRDVSVFSLGYSSSSFIKSESFLLTNHSYLAEKWMTDILMRLYWQNDNTGGKETVISPSVRLSYQAKESLSLEVEEGMDLTNNTPATGQSSKTLRKYFSLGLRSNF